MGRGGGGGEEERQFSYLSSSLSPALLLARFSRSL